MPFEVDKNRFPQNLADQLLPPNWQEDKWLTQSVYIRGDEHLSRVSLHDLIKAYAGDDAEFAGLEFVNETNGRQLFFGLHPESTPGNEFSSVLYHERAGGGSTLVVAAEIYDDEFVIALLDQERPLMGSGSAKRLQVPGGYPIEQGGSPEQIHRATAVAEGESEILGMKFQISPDHLINLGSPYNTNNGMVITGEGQGIAVQLLMIPAAVLVEQEDETFVLSRDIAEVTDRRLERIFSERFHLLDDRLLQKIHNPRDGYAACAKTAMAVDRAFLYLVEGID